MRRRGRLVVAAAALAALVAGAGCASVTNWVSDLLERLPGLGHRNLRTHAVRSIKSVVVQRIAVMPLVPAPSPEGSVIMASAASGVSAKIYGDMAQLGGWTVLSEEDVAVAMQTLGPLKGATLQQQALKLGELTRADAVLYGTLYRYRERIGEEFAAESPAAVAFDLFLYDVRYKTVIWSASYANEQKALTDNAFDLASFIRHRGRWVRAYDLAAEGAREAVQDLHGRLNLQPAPENEGPSPPAGAPSPGPKP
ncbi:MAG: hypothetical protein M1336_06780 [Deltaproteobacteria bacterium]|nr:hypothetical protein [Deltaproteobacteria bacterium]